MILPHNAIILVADGARMLVLRNDGDADTPSLVVLEHRETPVPYNRDLFADAPGRTFSSHSPTRSAYDHGDAHTAREHGFLAAAVASLTAHIAVDTPGIVIAADPASLGVIRQHYTPAITNLLLAEYGKDFTPMPVDEITRQLQQAELPLRR
jgi:protein required for attachment to host cells